MIILMAKLLLINVSPHVSHAGLKQRGSFVVRLVTMWLECALIRISLVLSTVQFEFICNLFE